MLKLFTIKMEANKKEIKKAIIVIHEATTGPGHDLRDYFLKHKIEELLFIAHPLIFLPENFKKSSRFEFYKNGQLIKEGKAFHYILPEPLLYVKDFIYSFIWSFKIKGRINLFFGLGNLNALVGLVLRFFGKVEKSVYYVIDYIPKRFDNKLLNFVYGYIEKFCAGFSNTTWNLSPRMISERQKKWGIKFKNQLVLLHGVHFDRIKRLAYSKINKTEIIYMGGLLKKQGIQFVIEALPLILKTIKNVKFTIIGSGQYEKELRNIAIKLRVDKNIDFLGYVKDHAEVENRLAQAALAVAIYEEGKDNFTYYTDPGKVKNYLGAGVPVLITDVPYIAKVIEKERCGIIVSTKKENIAKKIINFLLDEVKIKEYRKNAVSFAKKYDWDKLFDEALSPLV